MSRMDDLVLTILNDDVIPLAPPADDDSKEEDSSEDKDE